MLRNPYLNRSMIRAVDQFFGRRREVERVMARVGALTPQSVSVVGERREDIPLLLRHFLGNQGGAISPEALPLLWGYDWPGNIRELENQLASARAMAQGGQIEAEHLWPRVRQAQSGPAGEEEEPPEVADFGQVAAPDMSLKDAREIFERTFLHNRLAAYGWDLEEVSRSLDLSRSRLYELIRRHGLREE